MEPRAALLAAMKEHGWTATRAAFEAGLSERAIAKFQSGKTQALNGNATIALMRRLPGFARRLGFEVLGHAA
jgi:hypothetical protein